MCIVQEFATFLAPAGRHVYRKAHPYNSKPQIPGGLSVNSWLIEPSTLCNIPGIFDMCTVTLVISN